MSTTVIQKRRRAAGIIALVLAVVLIVVLAIPFFGMVVGNVDGAGARASVSEPTPAPTASPSPSPTAEACEPEFVQVKYDRASDDAKLDKEFDRKVAEAIKTNTIDPLQSAVLDVSGHNAQRLANYAAYFSQYEDANNWKPLVDGDCLSKEGISLYNRLDGVFHAPGVTFALAPAPENGINSGVDPATGTFGVSASRGIGGNRDAIEVTMPDGTKGWIMLRCGNPVFMGTPTLPHVPTDNPPPPVNPPDTPVCPWNPALPPNSPHCVQPKNPSEDPYVKGNAPVGGGHNANPGPGTYIPPAQMEQPPATPRVNPAPPPPAPPAQAPATPSNPNPAPVPTPDPAPAPPPQPSAPTPANPETGCVPIPGVMDC